MGRVAPRMVPYQNRLRNRRNIRRPARFRRSSWSTGGGRGYRQNIVVRRLTYREKVHLMERGNVPPKGVQWDYQLMGLPVFSTDPFQSVISLV